MPDPYTRVFELKKNGVPLTGGHIYRVSPVGGVERDPVLSEHQLRELVLVHRMTLKTLVVVVDDHPVTHLSDVRLRRRKGLSVEAQPDDPSIVQNEWNLRQTRRNVAMTT